MIASHHPRRAPTRRPRPHPAAVLALVVGSVTALAGIPAQAQPVAAAPPAAEVGESFASPRGSTRAYLERARAGSWELAARHLELPAGAEGRGAVLARRLKSVLDRHAWLDLAAISAAAEGRRDDGLPPEVDEITTIPTPAGPEPVRVRRGADGRWRIAAATVARIDAWYERLGDAWILERLPEPLLRPGPAELLWWQWIALPILLVASWFVGLGLGRLSRAAVGRLVARTSARWDDEILARIAAPLAVAWALAMAWFALPLLGLYAPAEAFVHRVLRTGFFVTFFWSLLRSVDVVRGLIETTPWARERPSSRSLLALGGRVAKVGVVAIAVVAILSQLGFPVASLVAGLGIGGLALALAAQKTVENLFGAFSIGVDQPFREGDFVRIEDFVGTVEAIGLRSTRIRTLDRTLISVPNGRLADMRLESFAARDRLRLACVIGLEYGTTAAQLRAVLAGLERVLREHPQIWPETVIVRFQALADWSLNIEVMAWFQTQDWGEFQLIRQEVLLSFMEVVEGAGASFAFPTKKVHVVPEAPGPRAARGG